MIRGMDVIETRKRRRVVVDHRELARAIGGRIRAARVAAGLTQQELAGDRYTKAYVSALELGHAKPSMAALDYLAPRLGTTSDRLIADHASRWSRLDADLHLASGRLAEAAEAYEDLAELATDRVSRGELLLGAAEAHCKLHQAQAASPLLIEAIRLLADRRPPRRPAARAVLARLRPHGARRSRRGPAPAAGDARGRPVPGRGPGLRGAGADRPRPARDRARRPGPRRPVPRGGARPHRQPRPAQARDLLRRPVQGPLRGQRHRRARSGRRPRPSRCSAPPSRRSRRRSSRTRSRCRSCGWATSAGPTSSRRRPSRSPSGCNHFQTLGHYLDTQATIRLARGDADGAIRLTDRALALEAEHGPANEQVGARITRAQALTAAGRLDEAAVALGRCGGGRARPVLAAPASPDPRGVGRVAGRAGSPRRRVRGHARGHLTAPRRHSAVREPVPKPAPPGAGG